MAYDWLNSSAAAPYRSTIIGVANSRGIDPSVLANQIGAESSFNPRAVSDTGAVGIAQILPSTARDPGYGLSSVDPTDPYASIGFAADYTLARGGYNAAGLNAYSGGSYSGGTTNNILNAASENYSDNPLFSGQGYYDRFSGKVLGSDGSTSLPSVDNNNVVGTQENVSNDGQNIFAAYFTRILVGLAGLIIIGGGLYLFGSNTNILKST